MEVILPTVIMTVIAALFSWRMPNAFWRIGFTLIAAFLFAYLSSVVAGAMSSDDQWASWQPMIIESAFKIASLAGIFAVAVIQVLKTAGTRKK